MKANKYGYEACRLIGVIYLEGGVINVSLESLASNLGSTRMKIRRAIDKLVAEGIVEVSSRRNAGTEIRLTNMVHNDVQQEDRPQEYWDELSKKFDNVLFDKSEGWSNALKRKWICLVNERGEEVADLLVNKVGQSRWIEDKGNLSLSLLISNADKILAGRYGKVFEKKMESKSTIKRSKAALCQGGDGSFDQYMKLFK